MGCPPVKLPWPLSSVQQYSFHFVIHAKKAGSGPVKTSSGIQRRELERPQFGKGDLERAIDRFLSGLDRPKRSSCPQRARVL